MKVRICLEVCNNLLIEYINSENEWRLNVLLISHY